MGVSVEVWRARIGQFLGPRKRHKSAVKRCSSIKLCWSVFALLAVTCVLHLGNNGLHIASSPAAAPLKPGALSFIDHGQPFVFQNTLMFGISLVLATEVLLSKDNPPASIRYSPNSIHQIFVDNFHLLAKVASTALCLLLLISGIEPNPGPFPCKLCSVIPETIASSVRHQLFHAKSRSYLYYCPVDGCGFRSSSFASLNYHVSLLHRDARHIDPVATEQIVCSYLTETGRCAYSTTSLWQFVQHLCKEHLDAGIKIQCPISQCTHSKDFEKSKNFRVHLSQYHKNWRAEGCPAVKDCFKSLVSQPPMDNDANDVIFNLNENSSGSFDNDCNINSHLLDDQLILDSIAKFYLHMYAQNLLPMQTIQEICDGLVFLTEVVHSRMKLVLLRELRLLEIPEDKINSITRKVLDADLLYSSHHKTSLCPTLSTDFLRKKYFKDNFNFIEPEEINLEPNNPRSKKTLQYVSIQQSLNQLLQDHSVQREVDASFEEQPGKDPDEIRNYTDGELFKSEKHSPKEIHISLYQDSFNPVMNALGSAKNKFKDLVVYFTISSIRSHLRSRVDSKHLVLICREAVFKLVGAKKCLEGMVSELKILESTGILYKGEMLKVFVTFMLGDNLGQNFIGGFIENFSVSYMCRFCEIKREEFKANPSITKPPRTVEEYNRCVYKAKLTEKPVKGIKSNCELNCLHYFHAVSHLPVCIAHDLFEGTVSRDLSGIIAHFIRLKWFSYKLLNARIRNFKCVGIDGANKPAFLNEKGMKLGGHAVQNWMLLRLLYFLIGDKIRNFENPGWTLYLKLKELCEFFCAPSFKKSFVPYIKDVLIPSYFELRSSVLSIEVYGILPKHHFMAHYPQLMLKYGPLIHLWTMPYEQKHKFFKELMRKSKNFINPERTCGIRQQMKFCYTTSGTLFEHGFVESKSKKLSPNSFSGELSFYVSNLNWQDHYEADKVCSDGINYKKNDTLLLSAAGNSIEVGIIKVIATKNDVLKFIIEMRSATYQNLKGIYEIDDAIGEFAVIVSPSAMKYPVPQPVYLDCGRSCFSLKHAIIKSD